MTETDRSSPATQPEMRMPAVDELVARARALASTGSRRLLGITGAPGAGKSTLCAALLEALGADAVLVGMDGFHLADAELIRLGRRDRKGAPDTFDVDGYIVLLGRLREQSSRVIYAPVFDRGLEESIGGAVPVNIDTPLVITEGNYLLHDHGGWADVRDCLDEVWYLDVPAAERADRLVARRRSFGESAARAQSWVHTVDTANGVIVENSRERADLLVTLSTSPVAAPGAATTEPTGQTPRSSAITFSKEL